MTNTSILINKWDSMTNGRAHNRRKKLNVDSRFSDLETFCSELIFISTFFCLFFFSRLLFFLLIWLVWVFRRGLFSFFKGYLQIMLLVIRLISNMNLPKSDISSFYVDVNVLREKTVECEQNHWNWKFSYDVDALKRHFLWLYLLFFFFQPKTKHSTSKKNALWHRGSLR